MTEEEAKIYAAGKEAGKKIGHQDADLLNIKMRVKRLEAGVALIITAVVAQWARFKGLL
jgi:hypothetical protein